MMMMITAKEKVINADTVDAAVQGILHELKDSTSRENIIYFDGWDGLGASAVLRAVAQRLELKETGRPPELEFERVIHVDCSKWRNTRTIQREVAKQLKLTWVTAMIEKQEEEDDFNGVTDESSRVWITYVAEEIHKSTLGLSSLLVLHNGSNEEIDISNIGLSMYGFLNNKVIWTFQGRFRMDPSMKDKVKRSNMTHRLLSASPSSHRMDPQELWSYLLQQEAAEVASKHGIDPATAVRCFLYTSTLHCTGRHPVDIVYDLASHTCNYWICDGLIQQVGGGGGGGSIDEEAWRVGDALQGEMRLDMEYYRHQLPPQLVRYAESMPHWTSPAYGFVPLPHGVIPSGMFQHQLCVLKLSRCAFSFSSPPFACCHMLRFLWLHHCQDLGSTAADKGEDTAGSWACFKSLWVLDLRYTDWDLILSAEVMDLMTQLRELNVMGAKNWDMSHIRGRLRNIRKLRVTMSTCHGLEDKDLLSEMKSMELVEFSGNQFMQGGASLSLPAGSSSLETAIVDGCDGLRSVSLSGCRQLKKVLLKGDLPRLEELDLSGTRVKTLDLGQVTSLKRLILLGCQKLVAVKWPSDIGMVDVVRIDTTSTAARGDRSLLQRQKGDYFERSGWKISVADARLLRSLCSAIYINQHIHIDICPAAAPGGSNVQGASSDGDVLQASRSSSKYRDVLDDVPAAAMVMWECPGIHTPASMVEGHDWYVKVFTPGAPALELPIRICDVATSLHLYDDSSITGIPYPPRGSSWNQLRWCRVERCPKLQTLFPAAAGGGMRRSALLLVTIWGSELLMASYIWDDDALGDIDCRRVVFLHLDNCPRLTRALPLFLHLDRYAAIPKHDLETLEIVSCGDLTEVFFFPLAAEPERQQQDTVEPVEFPRLKHIHLHELPMLQHICRLRICAPKLETIKIRGCWSLSRLPAIGKDTKPPMVDCEKEWWDMLQWDGLEAGHHPSLYRPRHVPYYKAQLPRGSLLR